MPEQQGIQFNAEDFNRYQSGEDAVKMLFEHLRYAGIVTDDGAGKFTAWLNPEYSAEGPVKRVHSFGTGASLRVRNV